jgi:hypothetical protein
LTSSPRQFAHFSSQSGKNHFHFAQKPINSGVGLVQKICIQRVRAADATAPDGSFRKLTGGYSNETTTYGG